MSLKVVAPLRIISAIASCSAVADELVADVGGLGRPDMLLQPGHQRQVVGKARSRVMAAWPWAVDQPRQSGRARAGRARGEASIRQGCPARGSRAVIRYRPPGRCCSLPAPRRAGTTGTIHSAWISVSKVSLEGRVRAVGGRRIGVLCSSWRYRSCSQRCGNRLPRVSGPTRRARSARKYNRKYPPPVSARLKSVQKRDPSVEIRRYKRFVFGCAQRRSAIGAGAQQQYRFR